VFNNQGSKVSTLAAAIMSVAALTSLPFQEACDQWLETRRHHISAKTFHEYELNIDTLGKFFGEMRLTEIDADMIRRYQRMRMTKCGPHSINHECSVLQQVLKRIGRWAEIGQDYQPLPLPKTKRGRAITPEEREKLWRIMRSNPNWDAARLCATICINSTASPGEAYKLKHHDVDMKAMKFIVGRNSNAKTDERYRRIPMNDESFEAFRETIARAKILGSYKPEHYIFPFWCFGREYDPDKHQTTFRTAWEKIIAQAVKSGLNVEGLRLEDMRHTAKTLLLESGEVSGEVANEIAGHIDDSMNRFYSHIGQQAKQKAVDCLSSTPKKPVLPEKSTVGPVDNRELAQALIALAAKLLNSA